MKTSIDIVADKATDDIGRAVASTLLKLSLKHANLNATTETNKLNRENLNDVLQVLQDIFSNENIKEKSLLHKQFCEELLVFVQGV